MLGLLEDASRALTMAFRNEGDAIVFLDGVFPKGAPGGAQEKLSPAADPVAEFCSSEYARTVAGVVGGTPPRIDLAAESRLIEALVALASQGILASAHDVSDGGIAVALAESGFVSAQRDGLGSRGKELALTAQVAWDSDEPSELALFGEGGARAIVSVSQGSLARLLGVAAQYKVAARRIGQVTRGAFQLTHNGVTLIRDTSAVLRAHWSDAVEQAVLGEHASKPRI